MDKVYLQEAFRALDILNEEDFNLSSVEGAKELKDFIEDDEEKISFEDVIDPEAETEEELKDDYVGNVVLDCCVCHSKLYKNPEDVEIDEEQELANIDEECPFCYSTDGYKIVGQIVPYKEESDEVKIKIDDEPVEVKEEGKEEEKVEVEESFKRTRKLRESNESHIFWDIEEAIERIFLNHPEYQEITNKQLRSIINKVLDEFENKYPDEESETTNESLNELFGGNNNDVTAVLLYSPNNKDIEVIAYSKGKNARKIASDYIYKLKEKDTYDGRTLKVANYEAAKKINKNFMKTAKFLGESLKESKLLKENNFISGKIYADEDGGKYEYAGINDEGFYKFKPVNKFALETCKDISMDEPESFDGTYAYMDEDTVFYTFIDWKEDFDESLKEDIEKDKHLNMYYSYDEIKPVGQGTYGLDDGTGHYTTHYGISGANAYVAALFQNNVNGIADDLPEVNYIWGTSDGDRSTFYVNTKDKEELKNIGQKIIDRFAKEGVKLNLTSVAVYNQGRILTKIKELPEEAFTDGLFSGYEVKPRKQYKNESLKEHFEKVEIETDREKMEMTSEPGGKTTIVTEPKEEVDYEGEATGEEMIAPVSDEVQTDINDVVEEPEEEIEEEPESAEGEEVDMNVDEFSEDEFDELGESYLKKVYENVNSFKTSSVKMVNNKLIVEGLINFNSGKQKKTSFIFEGKDISKKGKVSFIGENVQLSKGKKAFTLKGTLSEGKFIAESLNYNYRTKDSKGNSTRLYGTVKVSK